jgi:small GTP-binding protein
MDALRGANVAEKEAGGITQSVAAFTVSLARQAEGVGDRRAPGGKAPKSKGGKTEAAPRAGGAAPEGASAARHVSSMTFLDTPGHALFSSMRRRGTALTDLVVLVVDGKDGVMPQTVECVKLIQEAELPVVVAVTKCDLVDADTAVPRIAKQLLEAGMATEATGGEAPIVPISAKVGWGPISHLQAGAAVTRHDAPTRSTCLRHGARHICSMLAPHDTHQSPVSHPPRGNATGQRPWAWPCCLLHPPPPTAAMTLTCVVGRGPGGAERGAGAAGRDG